MITVFMIIGETYKKEVGIIGNEKLAQEKVCYFQTQNLNKSCYIDKEVLYNSSVLYRTLSSHMNTDFFP